MRSGLARRVFSSLAAGLAVLLVGAACSSASSTGATANASIAVGALPIADTVGLYIAVHQGFFKQHGLNVTIDPVVQSTAAIPDMESGKIAIVAGANYISYFQQDAKSLANPPFSLLAEGTTCSTGSFVVLTLPFSHVTTPQGLAGKTIAVNIPNNVQTLTINTLLSADGVNPASVHYVVIPFPAMIAALKAHKVAAISVVEPFASAAELSLGAAQVLDECTGPTAGLPLSGYFATQSWAQRHPDLVRAFQQGLAQGQAVADTNRGLVEKTMESYIPKLSAQEAAVLSLNHFSTSLDPVRMQSVVDLMANGGLLGKQAPFSVSKIIAP